jgi:hypothetical protein
MNIVLRLRKQLSIPRRSVETPHGKRYDWGKWYLHIAKTPHFWNIKAIVDIRGRIFVI